jgi:hypothetical protein
MRTTGISDRARKCLKESVDQRAVLIGVQYAGECIDSIRFLTKGTKDHIFGRLIKHVDGTASGLLARPVTTVIVYDVGISLVVLVGIRSNSRVHRFDSAGKRYKRIHIFGSLIKKPIHGAASGLARPLTTIIINDVVGHFFGDFGQDRIDLKESFIGRRHIGTHWATTDLWKQRSSRSNFFGQGQISSKKNGLASVNEDD